MNPVFKILVRTLLLDCFSESHKTKSQLLAALCVVGKSTSLQKDLHIQLVDIARKVSEVLCLTYVTAG